MPKIRLLTATLALGTLALMTGCPSPSTTPSPSPSPTATAAESPSPSPEASPSAEPTATPEASPTAAASPSPTPSPSPSAMENAVIEFKDGELAPANVTIYQYGTVTWTNPKEQTEAHKIVASDLLDFRGTSEIDPGTSATRQFSGLGSKAYYCTMHPDEKGVITIIEPSSASASDPSADDN